MSEAKCPTCSESFGADSDMKIHHKLAHGESIAREEVECVSCGHLFECYTSEKPGKYCPECVEADDVNWGEFRGDERLGKTGPEAPGWKGGKSEYNCTNCGQSVFRYEADPDVVFCTRECYFDWREGENHHAYIEQSTDRAYGVGWERARLKALSRDQYRCQNCYATEAELGQKPDAHHVRPVRFFDDSTEAHTLENLVALCKSCHRKAEEGKIPGMLETGRVRQSG